MTTLNESIGGVVRAAALTASDTAVATPARVRGLHIAEGANNGSVTLRDGGSGGTVVATIHTGSASQGTPVVVPGGGLKFGADVYAELSNVSGVTVFYH